MGLHPPIPRHPVPPATSEWTSWEELGDRWEQELAPEATDLGASATLVAVAHPFVVRGSCDGRAFFLRERNGAYRVTMATSNDPDLDPWSSGPSVPSLDVAGGPTRELHDDRGEVSAAVALRLAVDAVRTTLLRFGCAHPGAHPHCPVCGVRRADAGRWREVG